MENKMTLNDFWGLVERWKNACPLATDEYTRTAWRDLKKLELPQVTHFKEIMDTYLDHAYAPGLWEAATAMKNGCSDDSFLYFRAWLIAQGKETYLEALRDPDTLSQFNLGYSSEYTIPSFCDFEEFLYFPSWAYRDLTGSDSIDPFYDQLQGLSQEELGKLRSEIHYAPWIGQMSRNRKEMEEHLPKLMEKTGFSGGPGWLHPDRTQSWGCDWQLKPNPTIDQSIQM